MSPTRISRWRSKRLLTGRKSLGIGVLRSGRTGSKKSKAGYYLAVNFEGFAKTRTKPCVRRIRFGWLDHADWIGQKAATGQQARLRPECEAKKLIVLYESAPTAR